jgi:hypothetical protein
LIDRVPEEPESASSREPEPEPSAEAEAEASVEPSSEESAEPESATPERRRQRLAVAWAIGVAVVAALGVAGFLLFGRESTEGATAPSSTPTPIPAPVAPAPALDALPAPEALTDVLFKIVDPAVPGSQKLGLVEAAAPDYAGKFDQFSKALQDNGFLPVDVTAANLAWASHPPGNITADVSIHSQNPALANGFTFPMEFRPTPDGGWQLSRTTADILLQFAQNPATPTPTPTPTP